MTVVKSYAELGRSPMVGDRVLISKNAPLHTYWAGAMMKHVGTIMTVRRVYEINGILKMEEDANEDHGNTDWGWDWFPPMIEGVVLDCAEEIDEDPSVWTSSFTIDDLLTS